jgi:hypothetical protein
MNFQRGCFIGKEFARQLRDFSFRSCGFRGTFCALLGQCPDFIVLGDDVGMVSMKNDPLRRVFSCPPFDLQGRVSICPG